MSSSPSPALRRFRWGFLAGAIYDYVFAGLMLFAPGVAVSVFGLPLPGERFYLWLMAIFLLMLGAFYLALAHRPETYLPLAPIAAVGRLLGALAFVAAWWLDRELVGLLPLAAADLGFGLWHGWTWSEVRR